MISTGLDSYFHDSIYKSERATKEIIDEISTIVSSIVALQAALSHKDHFLLSSTRREESREIGKIRPEPLSEYGLLNLFFSIRQLISIVKSNSYGSLTRVRALLREHDVEHLAELSLRTRNRLQTHHKALIRTILILENLDEALSDAEAELRLSSGI